jgi:hypothetical protein
MMMMRRSIAAFAIATVCVTIGVGLFLLGSPGDERLRRLDERRVNDLRALWSAAYAYWARHARLPGSLDELARETPYRLTLADPETGQQYEYRVLGSNAFELCATFRTESDPDHVPREPVAPKELGPAFWAHRPGRRCFPLDVPEKPPDR